MGLYHKSSMISCWIRGRSTVGSIDFPKSSAYGGGEAPPNFPCQTLNHHGVDRRPTSNQSCQTSLPLPLDAGVYGKSRADVRGNQTGAKNADLDRAFVQGEVSRRLRPCSASSARQVTLCDVRTHCRSEGLLIAQSRPVTQGAEVTVRALVR